MHWWGDTIDRADNSLKPLNEIPCIVGNMHQFKRYCQNYLHHTGGHPFPELMRKIHIFNLENGMNNPTVEWMYKPQLCVLKPQNPLPAFISEGAVMGFGCKPIGFRKYKLDFETNEDNDARVSLQDEIPGTLSSVAPGYNVYIEHIGSSAHGFAEFGGCLMPPSLHTGCLPVHSYSTTPTDDDIQDITVIYKVETLLEMEYSYDLAYPYANFGNAHSLYTADTTFINQHQNVNAYGYKCKIQDDINSVRANISLGNNKFVNRSKESNPVETVTAPSTSTKPA